MDINEFTTIKEKVNDLKLKNAAAQGKIETIEESWKNKYGFTSLEDAKKHLENMNKEIEEKNNIRNKYMEELKNSFNWENY